MNAAVVEVKLGTENSTFGSSRLDLLFLSKGYFPFLQYYVVDLCLGLYLKVTSAKL